MECNAIQGVSCSISAMLSQLTSQLEFKPDNRRLHICLPGTACLLSVFLRSETYPGFSLVSRVNTFGRIRFFRPNKSMRQHADHGSIFAGSAQWQMGTNRTKHQAMGDEALERATLYQRYDTEQGIEHDPSELAQIAHAMHDSSGISINYFPFYLHCYNPLRVLSVSRVL